MKASWNDIINYWQKKKKGKKFVLLQERNHITIRDQDIHRERYQLSVHVGPFTTNFGFDSIDDILTGKDYWFEIKGKQQYPIVMHNPNAKVWKVIG